MSFVEEIRRVLERRPKLVEGLLRGTTYRQIGSGAIINTIMTTIDQFVSTVQEKRPKIIPTVIETIQRYEPGKIVKTLVPTFGGAPAPVPSPAPTPTPPPSPTYRKTLLRG